MRVDHGHGAVHRTAANNDAARDDAEHRAFDDRARKVTSTNGLRTRSSMIAPLKRSLLRH